MLHPYEKLVFYCLFPIIFSHSLNNSSNIAQNDECKPGETRDTEDIFYVCKNGKFNAHACKLKTGRQVQIDTEKKTDDGVYSCIKDLQGQLKLKQVACVEDDKVIMANQTLKIGSAFIECRPSTQNVTSAEDSLEVKAVACANKLGQQVPNGELIENKNGAFVAIRRCEIAENKVVFRAQACRIDKENLTIPVNQDVQSKKSHNFYYRCSVDQNDRLKLEPVACAFNGSRVNVSETFILGSLVYSCVGGEGRIGLEATACSDIQKRPINVGQTFEMSITKKQKTGRNILGVSFLAECVRQLNGGTVRARRLKCIFQSVQVEPGCARKFPADNLVFGCRKYSRNQGIVDQDLTRAWFYTNISQILTDNKGQENVINKKIEEILTRNNLKVC